MQESHVPYFYIIQDKRNNMYYVGSKYSKTNTNPATFMTETGYKTSSSIINEIIKQHGLDVFLIRKLKTFPSKEEVLEYETRFLKRVSARNNPLFYNKHNNDGYYDEKLKKQIFIEMFGEDNYFKTDQFKTNHREYCIKHYGVEHHLMSKEVINKRSETNIEKYGVECVFSNPEIMKKCENTSLKRYGVKKYSQTKEFKENFKDFCQNNYGVDHFAKTTKSRYLKSKIQRKNYDRDIVNEIKKLLILSKEYDIDTSNNFNVKHFWWQRKDEELTHIRNELSNEINRKKEEGYKKKTRKEKMQEINKSLYERAIVNEIRGIIKENNIKLGSAWWRKDEHDLNDILNEIK